MSINTINPEIAKREYSNLDYWLEAFSDLSEWLTIPTIMAIGAIAANVGHPLLGTTLFIAGISVFIAKT